MKYSQDNGIDPDMYLFCSKARIILMEGGQLTVVEALRYMSIADQSDLIVFAPSTDGFRRGLGLIHTGERGISPARCDEIPQPLDSEQDIGEPVKSNVCDPLSATGVTSYSCQHGPDGRPIHFWESGVTECRLELGDQKCQCTRLSGGSIS